MHRSRSSALVVLFSLCLLGCPDKGDDDVTDGGHDPADAAQGQTDGSVVADAGNTPPDGGAVDAAPVGSDASVTVDSGTPLPDAGTTTWDAAYGDAATVVDSGSALADASHPPDASVQTDAGVISVDGSVTGTPFEQVRIQWEQTLTLCNEWHEGPTRDEERDNKFRITLPPQPSTNVQPADLASSRLTGILAETGHLAAQHFLPPQEGLPPSLHAYDVSTSAGTTTLHAELAYNLGSLGQLVQTIHASRAAGDAQPIVPSTQFTSEVGFTFVPPGATIPVILTDCLGRPDLHDAVDLLRGEAEDGTSMLFIRYIRTRDVFAGSAPVSWKSTEIRFSDAPHIALRTHDFFSQIYSAGHHNWDDNSVVDFTRDPVFHHTVFVPLQEGTGAVTSAVSRVELNHIDNLGNGANMQVFTRSANGSEQSRTFTVPTPWKPVGDVALSRDVALSCSNGSVFALGGSWSMELFQVLTCPQAAAPGYALKGLVPVVFFDEPETQGTMVGEDKIASVTRDGRPGHSVQVGTHRVFITTTDRQYFYVEIVDAQGQPGSSFYTESMELGPAPDPRKEFISATNGTGVSMKLTRQWAAQGVGESSIYAPLAFELTFQGATHRITGMDQLRYTNTHHNWDDSLEARQDSLVYRWAYDFMTGNHTVSVSREDGTTVLAATELHE